MDLQQFLANKPLLVQLSKEYELLKKSGASVDFQAWVRQRLRDAAAELPSEQRQPALQVSDLHQQTRTDGILAEQLSLLAHPTWIQSLSAPLGSTPSTPIAIQVPGQGRPETVHPKDASYTAVEVPGTEKAHKAVAVPAVKRPPLGELQAGGRQKSPKDVPFLSKLYQPSVPNQLTRPDTYVQAASRPVHLGPKPDWVGAAKLHTALQGGSAAPHLKAAAERDRRLAVSTALAKQQLVLQEASGLSGHGDKAPTALPRPQVDHISKLTQQIAQQNELLAKSMQETNQQLKEQQALLKNMLEKAVSSSSTPPAIKAKMDAVTSTNDPRPPTAWFVKSGHQGLDDATRLTKKESERLQRKAQLKDLLAQLLGRKSTTVGDKPRGPKQLLATIKRLSTGAQQPATRNIMADKSSMAHPRMTSKERIQDMQHEFKQARQAVVKQPTNAFLSQVMPPAIESIEERARAILEKDAAEAEAKEKMQKVEELEQRMFQVLNRVEAQLERTAHKVIKPQPPPQSSSSAQESSSAVPLSEGLGLAEVHQMLAELNRLEEKENQIRKKWVSDSQTKSHHRFLPAAYLASHQPIMVHDGLLAPLPARSSAYKANLDVGMDTATHHGHTAQAAGAPLKRTHDTQPAAATRMEHQGYHEYGQSGLNLPVMGGVPQGHESLTASSKAVEAISDTMLQEVLAGRQRYLRAQKQSDGLLLAASDPTLDPVQVVEDVADMIVDEILMEHAEELAGMCDGLAEQLFDTEFKEPEYQRTGLPT